MADELKKLRPDGGNMGWTIYYKQLEDIKRYVEDLEPCSLEVVEEVVLAMVDLNFIKFENKNKMLQIDLWDARKP